MHDKCSPRTLYAGDTSDIFIIQMSLLLTHCSYQFFVESRNAFGVHTNGCNPCPFRAVDNISEMHAFLIICMYTHVFEKLEKTIDKILKLIKWPYVDAQFIK